MVVPVIAAHSDAVVTGKTFLMTGGDQLLTLPEQELFEINLSGLTLLNIGKVDIRNFSSPP